MGHRHHRQSGMSLITVVVAFGLAGMLALFVSKSIEFNVKGIKKTKLTASKQSVVEMVTSVTSCEHSLPSSCQPGTLLQLHRALKNGSSKLLVDNSGRGTQFGDWTVRAECANSGMGIILRAARLAKNGALLSTAPEDFLPDPLTKRKTTWQDKDSLMQPEGVELCASALKHNEVKCKAGATFCDIEDGNYKVVTGSISKYGGSCSAAGGGYNIHYVGNVRCPSGYYAVGGGARCQLPPYGGVMEVSHAHKDGRGWFVDCCVIMGGGSQSVYKNQLYVSCLKPTKE